MSEGRVEALYARLKQMTVNFQIRPGERINEQALAGALEASRTPLREALNRLVAEQLIDFVPGKGFFCRDLDARSIYELYELRQIIEVAAVQQACERASDDDVAALRASLEANGLATAGKSIGEVTEADEAFHVGLAALAGNAELTRELVHINERIRFIRWIDMASRVGQTKGEHLATMDALAARDADRAAAVLGGHIAKRMDQIVAAVKEGYSSIYVAAPQQLFERRIGDNEAIDEGQDGDER